MGMISRIRARHRSGCYEAFLAAYVCERDPDGDGQRDRLCEMQAYLKGFLRWLNVDPEPVANSHFTLPKEPHVNRPGFIAALSATVAAILAGPVIPAPAVAVPALQIGEAARLPGLVLKAFEDSEGEVYLAYSAEALVADFEDYTVGEFSEIRPDTLYTNAKDEAACDGRCASRGVPSHDDGGHDCFIVRDMIEQHVRAVDSGEIAEPRTDRMVNQLWTQYA